MYRASQQFADSFVRIRNMHSVYEHLVDVLHFNHSQVEDVLRSEIVYAISALDRLVHELIKLGMVETYLGTRAVTLTYQKFSLTIEQISNLEGPSFLPREALFEQYVINSQKHLAYQDPDKISSGLSLIWNEQHKWQVVATALGQRENDVKVTLKNIVQRRNQIVHESDVDLATGQIQALIPSDVTNIINFIENLGQTIYRLVK